MAKITLDVVADIPESYMVAKALIIIEGFDEDDDTVTLWTTTSEGVKGWQALGMLEACAARERASLVDAFVGDDDA